MNLTIMYSLPRSMTQWWRWFFAHGCHAVHDPLSRARHPRHLRDVVAAADGEPIFIADTSAIFFHEYLRRTFPGHKRIYMLRNPADVRTSLAKQGCGMPGVVEDQYARLQRHAWGDDNNLRLHYGCLAGTLDAVYTYVTGRTDTPPHALSKHVDRPLRAQYRDPAAIKSLFAYKDPA